MPQKHTVKCHKNTQWIAAKTHNGLPQKHTVDLENIIYSCIFVLIYSVFSYELLEKNRR